MQLLQIIRWKNLVMIPLLQGLSKYVLIPLFGVTAMLSNEQFVLLVLASIFIASGGYIINDICDLKADKVNKPDKVWIPNLMKIKNAKILYYSISFLGLALGVFLSISLKMYIGFIWFLMPILMLYYYL